MENLELKTKRSLERLEKMRRGMAKKRKAGTNQDETEKAKVLAKKRGKETKEEIARRKQTEAALARIMAKDSEEELSENEADKRPNTRSRRGKN